MSVIPTPVNALRSKAQVRAERACHSANASLTCARASWVLIPVTARKCLNASASALQPSEAVVGAAVATGAHTDQPPQRLHPGPLVVGPPLVGLQPAPGRTVLAAPAGLAAVLGTTEDHVAQPFPVSRCHARAHIGEPARARHRSTNNPSPKPRSSPGNRSGTRRARRSPLQPRRWRRPWAVPAALLRVPPGAECLCLVLLRVRHVQPRPLRLGHTRGVPTPPDRREHAAPATVRPQADAEPEPLVPRGPGACDSTFGPVPLRRRRQSGWFVAAGSLAGW